MLPQGGRSIGGRQLIFDFRVGDGDCPSGTETESSKHPSARACPTPEQGFAEGFVWNASGNGSFSDLFPFIVEEFLSGKRFGSDEELENAVTTCLNELAAEEYNMGILKLVDRCDKCLNVGCDYVEKRRKLPICLSEMIILTLLELKLTIIGHLKTLRYSRGDKKFNIFTKCNMIEATPQHLLDCVALVYDDLLKRPDFVSEVMKANDLMDLI
ncbi:hypothetical protein AVEN_188837-1 [Araneus ventricosus]|uniref:Uncharacterized protein n=1 Tax=Araneus ventricosus TaxID=182803 RepID=A0A4Y2BVF7_ARAVE|nr:hypothetical protein AVEN_188837-1 [Araneus ventricosus]